MARNKIILEPLHLHLHYYGMFPAVTTGHILDAFSFKLVKSVKIIRAALERIGSGTKSIQQRTVRINEK